MLHRSLVVLLCALAVPISAVINTQTTEPKIERREAPLEHKPFETYGLPPVQQQPSIVLPTPVYGVPAVANYPPPPPENPPSLPAQEYGIPVLKYGPPKVHVEYGPPPQAQPQPQLQSHSHSFQQSSIGGHHHHHQVHHGHEDLSFFEQLKQTFGFGSSQPNYPSHHQPHASYGPPPQAPVNHFLPPKPHSKYGPPTKPFFTASKPPTAYGPPPKQHFPSPKPIYGLPNKPAINFKPQQFYGPPPQNYGPPQQNYGPPQQNFGPPQQNYGPPPPPPPRQPNQQYGPPPSFTKHGAGCDGWKPIPGPSINQVVAHSNTATNIQSSLPLPENSYLPPASNNLQLADNFQLTPPIQVEPQLHVQPLQVQPLPTNLQLPVAEPQIFNGESVFDHLNQAGLGLTNINVIKSEGIELHSNNLLDSYSAPPADTYAPGFFRRPPVGLTPPNNFPYIQSHSHTHGLGIQHGSISGNLKQYPSQVHLSPPRQPIRFRAPVPQGLIESIGQNVLHQDTFGVKPNHQSPVYLPPPSNEIPPPPQGLESLPLAPAAPFHSHQSKANSFADQYIYAPSQCSHGPNLGNSAQFLQSIPQLQTVYGIPPQPLDVSQSSSFEIAQNAAQSGIVHSSYEAPASGAATSIDALINTHEVHAPSSSYGPPPSGNPGDSFAHGSQKSLSTVQIDSANSPTNFSENSSFNSSSSDSQIDALPGLSTAGLDIISAQKSQTIEIPIQGQLGAYSLQFQAADPLASQNNELDTPNHEKLLSDGLLEQILSAIEKDKSSLQNTQQLVESNDNENIQNHPDVKEFVNSSVGQETLTEIKAE